MNVHTQRVFLNSVKCAGRAARLCGLALLLLGAAAWAGELANHPGLVGRIPFRFAFSSSVLVDANENDAKAAMKVWAITVTTDRGIDTDPEPRFFKTTEALTKALLAGEADAVSVTTPEFLELTKTVDVDNILNASYAGQISEEFLLLVNKASGITRLEDLRGRSLVILQHPRTVLASEWLDTLIMRRKFGPAAGFFAKVNRQTKLTKAVLPVFFRQADACVVHRRGYNTMCELNPQLTGQLQILAVSPGLVPGLLCFRSDYVAPFKPELVAALTELDQTPGGRQLLTLFQCDQIERGAPACVDSARALLDEHERLLREASAAGGDAPPVSAGGPKP